MKKLILILLTLLSLEVNAQYRGTRQNAPLVRTEDYVTNTPGNSIANSKLIAIYKDSTYMAYNYPAIQFWNFTSSRNNGFPTSIAWFDASGYIQRSPIPEWLLTESDPFWTSDKPNYYDKTTSDGRFLQSFTEVDPVWSEISSLYRTKLQNDLLYQPIGSYLTSETDPLFNTKFSSKSTTDLTEGINLYYTSTRFNSAFSGKSTTDLGEGSNLYFTNTRSRSAISLTLTGTGAASYNSGTGVLNIPTPIIPTNTNQLTNGAGFLTSEVDGSITNEIQTLSLSGNSLSISSGNSVSLPIGDYTNVVNTSGGAGQTIYYLTSDKTSTGTALYTTIDYVTPQVNNPDLNYAFGWSYNSGTKALTVTSKASVGLNISLLSLTLLGVPSPAANGVPVYVLVKGH